MHKHSIKANPLFPVVILIIFMSGLNQTADAQDALWRSYYTAAQHEYKLGHFGDSKGLLIDALKSALQPDESLSTFYYLAHVCVKTENFQEAEQCYKTLLDGLGTKAWAVLRPPEGTPDWDECCDSDFEQTSDGTKFLSVLSRRPPELLRMRFAKPITIVDVLIDYGTLLLLANRTQEAEQVFKQGLVLSDCRPDHASVYEVKLLQKLGVLFDQEGRTSEGQAVREQLASARNAAFPDFDLLVSNTISNLSRWHRNPRSLSVRLNNLALFCATHGDYARAQTLFDRALSVLGETRQKRDKTEIVQNYVDLLSAMGKSTEAANLSRQFHLVSSVPPSKVALRGGYLDEPPFTDPKAKISPSKPQDAEAR